MTRIPHQQIYRGVRIHAFQLSERVESVVKPAIDEVFALEEIADLVSYAGNVQKPPEARLLAGLKVQVIFQAAVEERRARPNFHPDEVKALTAGLDSLTWISRTHFCSLLDASRSPPGGAGPARRPSPLTDQEIGRAVARKPKE